MICFFITGCHPFRGSATIELAPDEIAKTPNVVDGATAVTASPLAIDALRNPRWSMVTTRVDRSQPRWRQEAVDAVWSTPHVDREALLAATSHSDAVIAANAAICLARLGDDRGRERLTQAVVDVQVPLELRRAAVDALGHLTAPDLADTLRRLVDDNAGDVDANERRGVYLPELHAELLYALGRQIDAAGEARFAPRGPQLAPEVKLAALDAWSHGPVAEVPQTVADWRADVDPRVRTLAIQALAARRSSQALPAAQAGLNDTELEVRLTAIRALGQIGTREAHQLVTPLATHSGELIRAAAVESLDMLSDIAAVRKAAEDKSWRVRSAVADTLVMHPHADFSPLAQTLTSDRSLEVQRQTVQAVTAWPTPLAGPVLLAAIEHSSYSVKKLALEQLADRWSPAREHSIDLPPERAVASLAKLRQQWADEQGIVPETTAAEPPTPQASELSASQQETARAALQTLSQSDLDDTQRRAVIAQLTELGPELLPWLTTFDQAAPQAIPSAVYHDVLPKLRPEFRTLLELESPQITTRRRAAERLAGQVVESPLSPLAVERLTQILERENDPSVWLAVLRAIRNHESSAGCRLAYICIGANADEVRRMACEHLATHPAPEHVAVLLPVLEDAHPNVVRAAVRALCEPGLMRDPQPLVRLLAHADRRVRLDAAKALVQMNHEAGLAAMERLAFDNDTDIRRQTIQAMGQLARPEFLATLVQQLDEGLGIGQAAELSLSQCVGTDVTRQVQTGTTGGAERVAAWRRWWSEQQ
ncbi:MAG: HEAT repeat domain-containing protein [Planctomycetaceae bacterium]|nr:HEAT repeat domain-containing protein [Planctomycetaceae bacterium]